MDNRFETITISLWLMDFEDEELERLGLLKLGADDLKGVDNPRLDGVLELACNAFIMAPQPATMYSPPEHGGAELHRIELLIEGRLAEVDIDFDFEQTEALEERIFGAWRDEHRL